MMGWDVWEEASNPDYFFLTNYSSSMFFFLINFQKNYIHKKIVTTIFVATAIAMVVCARIEQAGRSKGGEGARFARIPVGRVPFGVSAAEERVISDATSEPGPSRERFCARGGDASEIPPQVFGAPLCGTVG